MTCDDMLPTKGHTDRHTDRWEWQYK